MASFTCGYAARSDVRQSANERTTRVEQYARACIQLAAGNAVP